MLGYHTPRDQAPPPPGPGTPLPRSRHPTGPGILLEQSMLGDTVNERAVHILLECILVYILLRTFVSHVTGVLGYV